MQDNPRASQVGVVGRLIDRYGFILLRRVDHKVENEPAMRLLTNTSQTTLGCKEALAIRAVLACELRGRFAIDVVVVGVGSQLIDPANEFLRQVLVRWFSV